jgi:hypothetical protein
LNALSKQSSSDEQQKIVASLQEISLALLSEPESFPDPVIRSAPTQPELGSDQESQITAIDPEDFVRSISEPESPSRFRGVGRENVPLSLIGVMRALFPPEEAADLEDEAAFADEPGELEDKKKKQPEKSERKGPAAPVGRYKLKLRADVELFIQQLIQPGFADACTATQLVQACAYPMAVAALGRKGHWVDQGDAVAWASQIFDVLFIERQKERGLLEKVHGRYKVEGHEMAFLKIVGDGTLWVTLLSALFTLPAGIPKALALRSMLKAKQLIANASAGRAETLLRRLNKNETGAILEEATGVTNLLSTLEQRLGRDYESLIRSQEELRLGCDVGDFLWKPIAGWAECKEKGTWGSNLKVHLHLRADIRLVSSKLFINVTKSATYTPEITRILDLMTRQAPSTTTETQPNAFCL